MIFLILTVLMVNTRSRVFFMNAVLSWFKLVNCSPNQFEMKRKVFVEFHMQILHLEYHRDHMRVIWERASACQATPAVHGCVTRPELPGHMLPDMLRLTSSHPNEFPDA